MRSPFLVILIIGTFFAKAQTDSAYALDALLRQGHEKSLILNSDNYYSPLHQHIKDSATKTISKVGLYLSAGGGFSVDGPLGGAGLLNGAIALKSHLLSFSLGVGGNFFYGGRDGESIQETSYYGILFGESIRKKNSLLALSAGIAVSSVYVNPNHVASHPENAICNVTEVIGIPVEFKYYALLNNGLGIGCFISENFISPIQFSSFYAGGCVVVGIWNKPKAIGVNWKRIGENLKNYFKEVTTFR